MRSHFKKKLTKTILIQKLAKQTDVYFPIITDSKRVRNFNMKQTAIPEITITLKVRSQKELQYKEEHPIITRLLTETVYKNFLAAVTSAIIYPYDQDGMMILMVRV